MKTNKAVKILFLFTIIISFYGCSLPEKLWKPIHSKYNKNHNDNNTQDQTSNSNLTESENIKSPKSAVTELSAVEIEWVVPQARVTKYILRYGFSPEDLTETIEIPKNFLTQVNSPKHGNIYRYLLSGIPSKSTIYYTLQAGNELGYSDPTPLNTAKSY